MDLIGFVCVLESKGLSHVLGSKGLCHQCMNRKHPYKQHGSIGQILIWKFCSKQSDTDPKPSSIPHSLVVRLPTAYVIAKFNKHGKKLLLWLESGMMMVLEFRIWIGLCFEQNFRIKIGFGYYWKFSERIGLSNFNIRTTLQLASPLKIHVFHLAIQPAGPPFSVVQN